MKQYHTVVLMRGSSGSGKTTFVQKNLNDALICSADHFFIKEGKYNWYPSGLKAAHKTCQDKFKKALEADEHCIVVDNTNTRANEMEPYIKLAKEFNYDIRIIRMEVPLKCLLGRNVHGVKDSIVEQMVNRMENIPESWGLTEIVVEGYEKNEA